MEQYIKKSALVAEIQKRRTKHFNSGGSPSSEYCHEDDEILGIIDTLEVKDLDTLVVLAEHLLACDAHGVTPNYSDREWDFLEGLVNNKAQKGE